MTGTAAAQNHPAIAVDLTAGWVGFADEGIVSERLMGGAVRWYVTPRLSIGPEVLYIAGKHHIDLAATCNVAWDLIAPKGGRPRRVTPFLVAGGGLFQTRRKLPPVWDYTSTEGSFTAGGGVRVAARDRVSIGIDARVGWPLHLRVNGLVGFRLTQ